MSITVAESEINYIVTTPPNADVDTLEVVSSNTEVATVTQDESNLRKFTILGVAEGEATLTASLNGKTASCTVTVFP